MKHVVSYFIINAKNYKSMLKINLLSHGSCGPYRQQKILEIIKSFITNEYTQNRTDNILWLLF